MLPLASYARMPDILAVVNDKPITLFDFESRKKLITTINNADESSPAAQANLNKAVLNLLIEEELLNQHAEKVGGKVSEADIDNAIGVIEERNKMPKGYLPNYLRSSGVSVDSFRAQIKGELIKYNIINSLSNSVSVSPQEFDVAVINNSAADPDVEAWVFTSHNDKDKTVQDMQKLKKRLTSCQNVNDKLYKNFADGEKFDRKLSAMPVKTQSIIKDTAVGSSSSVYQEDGKFKLVLVCEKKLPTLSGQDQSNINAFLSNKKMSKKAEKFFKDLRSRAYIKTNVGN